jgi:hypothetical protein
MAWVPLHFSSAARFSASALVAYIPRMWAWAEAISKSEVAKAPITTRCLKADDAFCLFLVVIGAEKTMRFTTTPF